MSTCFWVTGIWFVSIVEHFLAFFGDFWAKNGHFQAKIGLKWRFYCPKTLCFWAIDSNLSTGWSIRYFLLIFASRDIWSDMFSFLIYHKTHLRWLLANFHIFDSKIEQKQGNLAFRNFWSQKNDQKIDFLKSIQCLPPMSWVIRDRLGGLVSPLKSFYDHYRIRWKIRIFWSKNHVFWPWGAPQNHKNGQKMTKKTIF